MANKDSQIKCARKDAVRTAEQWTPEKKDPGIETTNPLQPGDWLIRSADGAIKEVLSDAQFRGEYTVFE